jgi:hypothetical protein
LKSSVVYNVPHFLYADLLFSTHSLLNFFSLYAIITLKGCDYMLDRKSEKILYYIIYESSKSTDGIAWIKPSDLGLSVAEYIRIFENLRKEEYLTAYRNASCKNDECDIYISQKGISYFKTKRRKNLYIFLTAIIPVIVSIIGIVIAIWK